MTPASGDRRMRMSLPYPKTKEEWWSNLEKTWVDILGILHRFIGMNDLEDVEHNITETPRYIEIEKMKENRDPRLRYYLSAAWINAPDVMGLHKIPGWGVLCDLLSEEHVLHE